MRPVQALIILFALAYAQVFCLSADWPMWMGPNLDGISQEDDWSVDWPDQGLPEVWSKEIGTGFSSVSIVDDLLYTMGHSDGRETVWCLQSKSGDLVWNQSYEAELNSNLYEGGPGSTPTVDGDFIYTLSVDGRLVCFQRNTGDVVWQKNLQTELGVRLNEWGFNSSPFILDEQLIVQGGRVASFDKFTGEKKWQSARHRAGYGSVRAFPHDGKTLLASLDCDGLRISNAKDGNHVAFTAWTSPYRTNSTTPIIVDDTIYISSGYNVGCGLFRLKNGELDEIYSNRRMRNHFNNSILLDGYLYGMDGNSNLGRVVTLTCMDFATGKVMWKQRGLGCGSLMIANNRLVILSEDGTLVVAEARPDRYQELARSSFLEGRCWTIPVLLKSHIYGRNAAGKLVCVALPRK